MTTATYAPTTPGINTTPPSQPYGLLNEILRGSAQIPGNIPGQTIGYAGNQQVGGQLGGGIGTLAGLFPFTTGPTQQIQNPQQAMQATQALQAQALQAQAMQAQAMQALAIAQQQAQQHGVHPAIAQHAAQQAIATLTAQQQQMQPYGFAGNQQFGGPPGMFPYATGGQQQSQWHPDYAQQQAVAQLVAIAQQQAVQQAVHQAVHQAVQQSVQQALAQQQYAQNPQYSQYSQYSQYPQI
jgi:hypothetical protein